jgi:CRISPR/Cas system endoribonuclease Cas6 (RAMP superfamily)
MESDINNIDWRNDIDSFYEKFVENYSEKYNHFWGETNVGNQDYVRWCLFYRRYFEDAREGYRRYIIGKVVDKMLYDK